jgi:hypothetical protein
MKPPQPNTYFSLSDLGPWTSTRILKRILRNSATMGRFQTLIVGLASSILSTTGVEAFVGSFGATMVPRSAFFPTPTRSRTTIESGVFTDACRDRTTTILSMANKHNSGNELKSVPPDMEGVPIPFLDRAGNSFIECYADSLAVVNGVEYTIGVPCDYSVALCYFDENQELIPVELDDALMDDIFPLAESIVAEEFGEELVLQRTPQTLTLVGELEEDDEEDFEEDDDIDEDEEDEEEVEVLLSFEYKDKEFNLVRLLDPILLVGKVDPEATDNRILLTPGESDDVMPVLEEMFLTSIDDPDDMKP